VHAWGAHLTRRDQYLVVRTEKFGPNKLMGKATKWMRGKQSVGFCIGECRSHWLGASNGWVCWTPFMPARCQCTLTF
jgi:hypothetical protein